MIRRAKDNAGPNKIVAVTLDGEDVTNDCVEFDADAGWVRLVRRVSGKIPFRLAPEYRFFTARGKVEYRRADHAG